MIAATLTYIDADLAEKQRKVQVVVFYGPQCIYTRQQTVVSMPRLLVKPGGCFRFNLYCLTSETYEFPHKIAAHTCAKNKIMVIRGKR